ncbi:hypothetical protein FB45DRAFT_1021929 [Roridomyces roridus]|uniref:F-box domain-containing protein n=1 Tax=Roridomyces roridus TaxID=1738132 RepID=A0AAD7C7C2_9AGAR|nr:hypothetical protein FB45DRAFT_1021929 [Roridomyces roridus]
MLITVLEEIRLYHDRWEHVEIQATEYALRTLLKGRMPMLRSLSMDMEDDGSTRPRVDPLDFPRLRTVSLNWFQYPVDWLPWGQVTSLTIDDMSSVNYMPILRDAIHLVDLTFIDCRFSNAESPADIPLTRVTSLVMLASDVQIFGVISTPALQTLQISGEKLGNDPIGTLGRLISRSGFKLQRLLITGHRSPLATNRVFRTAFPTIPLITFNNSIRSD